MNTTTETTMSAAPTGRLVRRPEHFLHEADCFGHIPRERMPTNAEETEALESLVRAGLLSGPEARVPFSLTKRGEEVLELGR
jgi:hypothetical protein